MAVQQRQKSMLGNQMPFLEMENSHQEVFVGLIKACADSKNLLEGKLVHGRILQSGHRRNRFLANLLIEMYGKCGSLEEAQAAFDDIGYPNVFSWNILLAAYAQNGHVEVAHSIFNKMSTKDSVSWNTMLAAYAQVGQLEEARLLFDKMPHRDVMSWTAMLQVYGQNGHLEGAKTIFHTMPVRNEVSWTAMLAAYAQNGHLEEAKILFDRMPKRDVVAWNAMIAGYAQNGDLEEAKTLFGMMPEQDVVPWNAMIQAYAQKLHMEGAKSMFDRMPKRNVISWTIIIAAYARNGYLDEAKAMLDSMPEYDAVAWNTILVGYAQNKDVEGAKIVFDSMPEQSKSSWNSIIVAYAQNGDLKKAKSMFDTMPERDVISWTAVITAFANSEQGSIGIELFRSMDLDGLKPNEITLVSVLSACKDVGMIDQARDCFVSMEDDRGVTPSEEHFCAMIDTLGRLGHLRTAEDLINSMPFLPSSVALLTLLDACRLHRDVPRAARVAEQLFGLEPDDSASSYVLLANIYAEASSTNVFKEAEYQGDAIRIFSRCRDGKAALGDSTNGEQHFGMSRTSFLGFCIASAGDRVCGSSDRFWWQGELPIEREN